MALSVDQIAMVAHEANKAYCSMIGDHTQVNWDMAPEWVRQSAKVGVGLVFADPSVTPEIMHNSWMAGKIDGGWKHGPIKAPDLLEHPCLVPYADLSSDHRLKDVLFLAIVRILGDVPEKPAIVAAVANAEPEAPAFPPKVDLSLPDVEGKPKKKRSDR